MSYGGSEQLLREFKELRHVIIGVNNKSFYKDVEDIKKEFGKKMDVFLSLIISEDAGISVELIRLYYKDINLNIEISILNSITLNNELKK